MSHDRCFTLVPEAAFALGLPDKGDRLARYLERPHHAMPEGMAERLHEACQGALPVLFSGARLPSSKRAVEHLFFGRVHLHRQLRVPVTGGIPMGLTGPFLAATQEVLRALRPSRIPGLDDALTTHHARLRTLLRHVDPHQMRWVTWVAH